jgi:hypothetical protein
MLKNERYVRLRPVATASLPLGDVPLLLDLHPHFRLWDAVKSRP